MRAVPYLDLGGVEISNANRVGRYVRTLGDNRINMTINCECPALPGDCALVLDGTSGTNVSTPDLGASDPKRVTGDIDMGILVAPVLWTPGTSQALIAKWAAGQRSYLLSLTPTGQLVLNFSNGTEGTVVTRTSAALSSPPARLAVRVTLNVDNGSTQHVTTFFTKPATGFADLLDDTGWSVLGTPTTSAGVVSIYAGAAPLTIGSQQGTWLLDGRVPAAYVKDGIDGTLVASPDFSAQAPGTTSFVDAQQNVWTLNGNAVIECPPIIECSEE